MIEELASRYRACLEHYGIVTCSLPPTGGYTDLPELTYAACLAHHGLLGSVEWMRLEKYDLTSIPAEHLASLVSSVTYLVSIGNVSGCDLLTILDTVRSKELIIGKLSLGSEETQAIVQDMESHVEEVVLDGDVTLDIRVLMEYSGQGKCRKLICNYDAATRYREQLKTWATSRNSEVTLATSRNWEVTLDNYNNKFIIECKIVEIMI